MPSVQLPTYDQMVEAESLKPRTSWLRFFEDLSIGQAGELFTPVFTGLTEVGAATKAGTYWVINGQFVYFEVVISPATSTSSVAGTTYFDFPLDIQGQGLIAACSGPGFSASGTAETNNRIYPPTWTTLTVPVTISGLVRAS
jgi:hypothetical protein